MALPNLVPPSHKTLPNHTPLTCSPCFPLPLPALWLEVGIGGTKSKNRMLRTIYWKQWWDEKINSKNNINNKNIQKEKIVYMQKCSLQSPTQPDCCHVFPTGQDIPPHPKVSERVTFPHPWQWHKMVSSNIRINSGVQCLGNFPDSQCYSWFNS